MAHPLGRVPRGASEVREDGEGRGGDELSEYEMQTMEIAIKYKSKSVFHDDVTRVSLDSEGGGAFMTISQSDNHVRIDLEEWPIICDAVSVLLSEAQEPGATE